MLDQWGRELGHVANVVGGMVRNNVWYGDGDRVYHPVAADKQRGAVAFINQNAFQTPDEFISEGVTSRLESSGAADRITSAQKRLLRALISESRIKRMAEHAVRTDGDVYRPVEMLEDVRLGIWTELESYPVVIDLYRRNLQRAHVELLSGYVKTEKPQSDLPALARGELTSIVARIDASAGKEKERTTALHLADLKARIQQVLDPRPPKETPNGQQAASRQQGG
jgi:hypothetical protein